MLSLNLIGNVSFIVDATLEVTDASIVPRSASDESNKYDSTEDSQFYRDETIKTLLQK